MYYQIFFYNKQNIGNIFWIKTLIVMLDSFENNEYIILYFVEVYDFVFEIQIVLNAPIFFLVSDHQGVEVKFPTLLGERSMFLFIENFSLEKSMIINNNYQILYIFFIFNYNFKIKIFHRPQWHLVESNQSWDCLFYD